MGVIDIMAIIVIGQKPPILVSLNDQSEPILVQTMIRIAPVALHPVDSIGAKRLRLMVLL
jgi:hypothetical protein